MFFYKGVSKDNVSLRRVSIINNVYHGRKGYEDDFFFIYMAFFVLLNVCLTFNEFIIGVLRLLSIAKT